MTAREVAGAVAADVTRQLADPVRALRDRLGLVVDHLERHVTTSTGPTPYPWRSLQSLRQDLAAAYLEATHLARRLDELARAIAPESNAETTWFDVGAAVDLGLRLANHHVEPDVELLFDLGETSLARGAAGTTALLVAQLVEMCGTSAHARPGSALSVRVAAEPGWVVVTVADNGDGSPHADRLGELARSVVAPWGASVEAASDPGRGCAFELRLMSRPD